MWPPENYQKLEIGDTSSTVYDQFKIRIQQIRARMTRCTTPTYCSGNCRRWEDGDTCVTSLMTSSLPLSVRSVFINDLVISYTHDDCPYAVITALKIILHNSVSIFTNSVFQSAIKSTKKTTDQNASPKRQCNTDMTCNPLNDFYKIACGWWGISRSAPLSQISTLYV